MPSNYTNNEFMRMREQAIVRARDMQRRAAIKQDNQGVTPNESSEVECEPNKNRSSVSFEKHTDTAQVFNHNIAQQKTQHTPHAQDNDRMLVMTLLLILIADGADKMLIFALMYIMM